MPISVTDLRCEEVHTERGSQYTVYIKTNESNDVHEASTLGGAFSGALNQMLKVRGVSLNGNAPQTYLSGMYLRTRSGFVHQATTHIKLDDSQNSPVAITAEHASALGALLLSTIKALDRLGIKVQAVCLKH